MEQEEIGFNVNLVKLDFPKNSVTRVGALSQPISDTFRDLLNSVNELFTRIEIKIDPIKFFCKTSFSKTPESIPFQHTIKSLLGLFKRSLNEKYNLNFWDVRDSRTESLLREFPRFKRLQNENEQLKHENKLLRLRNEKLMQKCRKLQNDYDSILAKHSSISDSYSRCMNQVVDSGSRQQKPLNQLVEKGFTFETFFYATAEYAQRLELRVESLEKQILSHATNANPKTQIALTAQELRVSKALEEENRELKLELYKREQDLLERTSEMNAVKWGYEKEIRNTKTVKRLLKKKQREIDENKLKICKLVIETAPLTCGWCGKKKPDKTCTVCGVRMYCSKKCQQSHWKNHKVLCKSLAKMAKQLMMKN